jgi:hypothetical protein
VTTATFILIGALLTVVAMAYECRTRQAKAVRALSDKVKSLEEELRWYLNE